MGRLIVPILFLLLPLAEIAAFVFVGREVGVGTTLMLVLGSMLAGIILLRVQGLGALRRLQQATSQGGNPGRELVHGVMIVIAGILLILPGFVTDILGILLFLPVIRDVAWRLLRKRVSVVAGAADFKFSDAPQTDPPNRSGLRPGPKVVDLDDDEYSRDGPARHHDADDGNRLR